MKEIKKHNAKMYKIWQSSCRSQSWEHVWNV